MNLVSCILVRIIQHMKILKMSHNIPYIVSNEYLKTVNLRSITLNEISRLSNMPGSEVFQEVIPFVSPIIMKEVGYINAYYNYRFDYMGKIETAIEFNKRMNEDTSFLENALKKITKIHETSDPCL